MNNNIQKYPAYKPSGAEWLGEIPEHWEAIPGFTILYEAKEKNKGMKRTTVLSLSYGKIRVKGNDELTGLVPESFETYQFVNKGDIIFRPTDLQNDHVSLRSGMSEFDGIITSAYLNLRLKPIADSKYYSYLFRGIDNNKVIYGLGSGLRQNIDFRDFKRFKFPFPPLHEQTAIASFLDSKTSQIDQAIAQKERMIELLKERRLILIHNAVTRGINPNVKMKDSGVEWIGEIPEHWEIMALKHIAKLQSGDSISPDKFIEEGGYPVFGGNGFRGYTDTYTNEGEFILIGRQGALCGNVNYAKGKFYASEHAIVVYPLHQENILWLGESIKIANFNRLSQTAAQPGIAVNVVKNVQFPYPPITEQKAISFFIQLMSQKITTALSLKEQEIEKLKEYKATLINSAVTGKIKV